MELWLANDLLSISALTVDTGGDGTYEVTMVADDDYHLWPDSPPYRRIDLNLNGQLIGWPQIRRGVKVVGTWGYSAETEATGLTGTLDSTTDTTLTASADATLLIEAGDTLITESEQLYVSQVADTVVTVQRAINGTTAAAHAATALYVRRYPRDIEKAVKLRVLMSRWDMVTGIPASEESRVKYAEYMSLLKPFTPVVI